MILDRIVERKKEEVGLLRKNGIILPAEFTDENFDSPRGFKHALEQYDGVAIIAEVKKASPSKGVICEDFAPREIALNYQNNGAQAVSVLTDVDFFQGSLSHMMQVRQAVSLPVLRKDFIIDEIQIEEASAHGADAILLIAAILSSSQITEYKQMARELGMDSLVEIHNEVELELAMDADADLIGINNRNLNDFSVDINTTFRLKRLIPQSIPVVSESGLKSAADLELLKEHDVCAALIGESLMRAGQDSTMLGGLRG
ncbi:MAG: indole-3-glycerol phosphate synthase TrpC [Desulfofustis sp.]|nr:indole-3-glycerol phosphate synthase TrpC [Desulfofustis sp.]